MYVITELSRACYAPTGGRLFFSIYYQTQDDAFKLAAQNWRLKVTADESFRPAADHFYEKEVITEREFVNAWNEIKNTAQKKSLSVWAGHLLTHSSKQDNSRGGLEFRRQGDEHTLRQDEISALTKLPWDKNGFLILAGCNTGNSGQRGWCPAQSFAIRQGVTTLGQVGYAYFSKNWRTYEEKNPQDANICLWAFERGKNATFGSGARMPGRVFKLA